MIYKTANLQLNVDDLPIEIELLSSLQHDNIVSYLCHFEDDQVFYLVMEKFGLSWRTEESQFETLVVPRSQRLRSPKKDIWLRNMPSANLLTVTNGSCASLFDFIDLYGQTPIHLQRSLFKQIASALYALHTQQIIHGDLKEENILIGIDPQGRHVAKLCDFGHARRIKRARPSMRFYGTRDISAPELLPYILNEDLDERELLVSGYAQDIWALGIVLYTMIHGSLPPNNEAYLNGELDLSQSLYYPTEYDSSILPGK